jgi:S1-C subfamily serine protease
VRQDEAKAVRWHRLAADQGIAEAQYALGVMYGEGRGVRRDEVLAYVWFNLAAAGAPHGGKLREDAIAGRDEVAKRLSQAERAQGQELARKWQPRLAARSEGDSAGVGVSEPPPVQRRGGLNPFTAELERRIREAQRLLADLGYAPGPVDGVIGPKTRVAIWAFQADIGLPVDGQFSDELIAALREAATRGQRVAARPAPAQPRHDGAAPWERYGAAAAPTQRQLDSTGSGFAVSANGQIVTNHHVVADCAEVRVRPVGQEAVEGVVVAHDRGNDLALLHAPARLPAAALRNDSGIRPGDSVVAVGFPLPGLLASEANVTTGSVSALAGIGNDTRFLQMTVPVQPGNSGGPLLDLQGRVVGVVVGKLDALKVADLTGDIPQNVNFAIKAGVVRSFLDASGSRQTQGRSKLTVGGKTLRWLTGLRP